MEAIVNIHFTQLIRINNRLHEFNFRKRGDDRFDGDVSDEWGSRHFFTLIKKNDNWSMTGSQVAEWLRMAEAEIIKHITTRGQ